MGGLIRSEAFRLRHRLMPYVLVGLLAVIVGVLYTLLFLVLQLDAEEAAEPDTAGELEGILSLSRVLGDGMDLAYSVAGVMAIILASTLIASEYAWGTIRTMLPRSSTREAFIGAKLLVIAGFVVILGVVSLIAALASSAIVSYAGDLDRDLPANFPLEAIAATGRTVLAMFPYAAFAFMLALLTRSTGAAIGVVSRCSSSMRPSASSSKRQAMPAK